MHLGLHVYSHPNVRDNNVPLKPLVCHHSLTFLERGHIVWQTKATLWGSAPLYNTFFFCKNGFLWLKFEARMHVLIEEIPWVAREKEEEPIRGGGCCFFLFCHDQHINKDFMA